MGYDMKGLQGLCKSLGGEFEGKSEKDFNCHLEDKDKKKSFWEGIDAFER